MKGSLIGCMLLGLLRFRNILLTFFFFFFVTQTHLVLCSVDINTSIFNSVRGLT